jgi:hypothetical protein
MDSQFLDDKNFETHVYYSSYSVNRLNKYDFRCQESGTENSVLNANDCLNDCLLYLSNKTYGCIAIHVYNMDINLDMNLLDKGYRICSTNISLKNSDFLEFKINCLKKCPLGCREIHFENRVEFYRKLDKNSTTKRINFIPIKTAHIEYLETLKVNFNQLIYTCGGIVGLWFGLSPNQISNLVLIILQYLKSFVNYLLRVIHQNIH